MMRSIPMSLIDASRLSLAPIKKDQNAASITNLDRSSFSREIFSFQFAVEKSMKPKQMLPGSLILHSCIEIESEKRHSKCELTCVCHIVPCKKKQEQL